MFVRQPYNYDMDEVSVDTGLVCLDRSLCQQQFVAESDINTIVDRYGLNGELPAVVRTPQYGDFTQVSDFQTALNSVLLAQAQFSELPAKLRSRFSNDPQRLLEFLSDSSNRPEALSLGLVSDPIPVGTPIDSLKPS